MTGQRSHLAAVLMGLVAAAGIATTTAGCGATAHVGTSGTLRVALGEYRVNPQDVRSASGTLTIYIHNYGRLTHNLVISRGGTQEAASTPVAPGQSTDLQATLAPGAYVMSSSILNDRILGAYGTLHVG